MLIHYTPYVSLYPMCGGNCKYLESFTYKGLNLDNLFGFFYCKVETTSNYLGLLPYRDKSGLLLPNGKWSGWYFSEELKFAKDNGYKITVIKGYNFDKEYNVFNKYFNTLYKIKSTTKDKVEKTISKSLMNNLLGRYGMDPYKAITEIVDKEKYDFLVSTREFIGEGKQLMDNCFLVTYKTKVFQ